MTKNCRLVDNEDKRCIECPQCYYKEDRKRRPWIYEGGLNISYFGKILVKSKKVKKIVEQEKEEHPTLDAYFK